MKNMYFRLRRAVCILTAAVLVLSCAPALGESAIHQWVNTDVENSFSLLTRTRLRDDFHMAVNRQWLLFQPIPYGASEASSFVDQASEVLYQKAELIQDESLIGHDADLMRALYGLTLDWDTRNALGAEPLRPYVEAIQAIDTLDELTAYMTTDQNVFLLDPSVYTVGVDPAVPDRWITMLYPTALILEDSAEYSNRTEYGELLYGIAEKSALLVLRKLGYSQEAAQAVFDGAMAFDALVAPYIKTNAEQYAPDYLLSTLNYYDRAGLEALCGAFPMPEILDLTGFGASEEFLVTEPEYFRAMSWLYTQENVPLMRDWLLYYLIAFYGDALDRSTYMALDNIYCKAMGIAGAPDDLDIALEMLEKCLPVPMDNLYIQAYCTEEIRQDIRALIDDTISHYRVMLENEDWLSPETREKAVDKLNHIRVHAVYPDTLGDWSALTLKSKEEGGTLLEALIALNDFSVAIMLQHLNQPVDHDEWDQLSSPTSDVNAYYSSSDNSITILAGLLGGAFYRPDMSLEEKLGGIGMIIGHEISHAFDVDGAHFDANGHLNNWWTEEDYAAFQAKAARVAAYYDGYVPYAGGVFSGAQVQSEAIADMGGMKCALAIAREQESFDYDAFFRQFAEVWRTKMNATALMVTVATDDHPLGCLRTNVTVQQFDEFYDTYGVQPGDGMYLAPEDRVAVW